MNKLKYSVSVNDNVVYFYKTLKELKISSEFLKNIHRDLKFYNTSENKKSKISYFIKNNFTVIETKQGDEYDSFDFAVPNYQKQYLMKPFIF